MVPWCIYKKPSWRHDATIVNSYENQVKCEEFLRFTSSFPRPFYTRYYWSDVIKYKINNPEIDCSWPLPKAEYQRDKVGIRRNLVAMIRSSFSQCKRNAKLNLADILVCPDCRSIDLDITSEQVKCKACCSVFSVRNGIPVMYPSAETDYPGL